MWKQVIIVLSAACASLAHHERNQPLRAVVVLKSPAGQAVGGNVTFTQAGDRVRVEGALSGLPPGHYGFHVHEKGDLTGGCLSTGSHYNPEHKEHGAPEDENRHVGDLGNVVFDENQVATINFEDAKISLAGEHCILGRAVVLHERADDLGRTKHPDSRKTGNAGGRLACGVIGLLEPVYGGEGCPSEGAPHTRTAPAALIALLTLITLISSPALTL